MIPFITKCRDHCKVIFTPANVVVFFVKLNHWFLSALLLLLYPVATWFCRLIDPTAAPIDSGVFSVIYIALIAMAVILGFATTGQRINHKPSFTTLDDDTIVEKLLNQCSPFQQLIFSLCVFSLYCLVGALCFLAAANLAG